MRESDLHDIQAIILRGYPFFPDARFLSLGVTSAEDGRRFLTTICGSPHLASAASWSSTMEAAIHVALTHRGLKAVGVPAPSLDSFPGEFRAGMQARAEALGDVGAAAPSKWESAWRGGKVDLLVMVYARRGVDAQKLCDALVKPPPPGITVLDCQEAGALEVGGKRERFEHFGFADGLSNPDIAVEGISGGRSRVGNPDGRGGFRPVAVGEFLLGHPDEGREVPPLPVPHLLVRNGTYLVYRKLFQDVPRFRAYVREQAAAFRGAFPEADEDFVAAKLMGRWQDGTSLIAARRKPQPGHEDHRNDFGYADDPDGARCPLGSHVRRAYPRDSLGFPELANRRRIVRRGMPYGTFLPNGESDGEPADRGLIFIALNASIERQFEFLQQQWIGYGDDFGLGNDRDPIAATQDGKSKMVIQGSAEEGRPPFVCTGIPPFVTLKGGDYFFMPSLTALRLLAAGKVHDV